MGLIIPNTRPVSAPAIIRGNDHWTPRRMSKEFESAGRKEGQLAGTHIGDLVAARRVITLSPEAARKFGHPAGKSMAERNDYVIKRSVPFARAWCDATGQFHPGCIVFFPKELA
jgi:hypothetical protein